MLKNYISYLFNKNKITLIFFYLLHLCFSVAPLFNLNLNKKELYNFANEISRFKADIMVASACISFIMSALIASVLVILLFKFVHKKASVDCYFALPISRKSQYFSILLFIVSVSYLFYVLNFSIILLLAHMPIAINNLVLLYLLPLVLIVTLVLFISATYLLANNIFDGLVISAAYLIAPFAIFVTILIFFSSFVEGINGFKYANNFITHFSLIGSIIFNYSNLVISFVNNTPISYHKWLFFTLTLLFYAGFGFAVSYRQFIFRQAERAEKVSDGLLAYKTIITFYTSFLIIGVTFQGLSNYRSWLDVLQYSIINYLLTFTLYCIGAFIYKRKISVDYKLILLFVLTILLSFSIGEITIRSRAFGLPYRYEKATLVSYSGNLSNEEVKDLKLNKSDHYQVNFILDFNELTQQKQLQAKVYKLLDAYRKNIIDNAYLSNRYSDKQLNNFIHFRSKNNGVINNYSYASDLKLSYKDLTLISQLVDVVIVDNEEAYNLRELSKNLSK